MYVIINTETKHFVALPGLRHSYTKKLQYARTFRTEESANKEICPENEKVVKVESLIGGMVHPMSGHYGPDGVGR